MTVFTVSSFLLITIDVPSFNSIEGQIKELQGVVPNTLDLESYQKSPDRIGFKDAQFGAKTD